MRDIKVSQVGTTWQLVNPSKGEIFLQGMEGALSYFITSTLLAPANNEAGLPLEVLAYRTASGHVWVKAVGTGRILSGLFESPGERVFFEGAYATLQQSFLFTQQTTLPELVTALASVTEGDTTHPVAASVIFEMLTALSQEFQNINTALGDKAPLDSPSLTGDALAPTREPGDNSTHIATTAYADDAANTAQSNAEGYADDLAVNLAPLVGGLVPAINLPSFVDDVLEFADVASFPVTGESGKIYIAVDTGLDYRWTGSIYSVIGQTPDVVGIGANAFPRYDQTQTLTTPQKAQLKTNIGLSDTDGLAEGATNKYFSEGGVRGAIMTGLSLVSGVAITATDSVLSAFGKLQKQITDLGTAFTSRGTGNTISAGCEAVNCTSTTVQGTNNIAMNCTNFTVAAAQKEAQFHNIRANANMNNLLFPKGSIVKAERLHAVVESTFQVVKNSANTPVLVMDSDGVKPAFTIGSNSPTYFNVAVHEITVVCGLGPLTAVRRVTARQGFGVTVTTEGTDVDTGIVFNITENAGRLDIALTGAGGFAVTQLTLEVMVRSFYGA